MWVALLLLSAVSRADSRVQTLQSSALTDAKLGALRRASDFSKIAARAENFEGSNGRPSSRAPRRPDGSSRVLSLKVFSEPYGRRWCELTPHLNRSTRLDPSGRRGARELGRPFDPSKFSARAARAHNFCGLGELYDAEIRWRACWRPSVA